MRTQRKTTVWVRATWAVAATAVALPLAAQPAFQISTSPLHPPVSRALPEETKNGFCELFERGYRHTELQPFVRQETRRLGLDRNTAGEGFYKLALECEQEFWARHLKDEARKAARR